MKTTKSQSRALAVIISARPRPHLWYVADLGWGANIFLLIVICHTFDRLAYRASPDNTSKSGWKYPHPRSSSTKPPPSRGPILLTSKHEPIPTGPRTKLEHIARPCIELENSPPQLDTSSLETTTTKMPAYNPTCLHPLSDDAGVQIHGWRGS